MSISQVKSVFITALGDAATCTGATMQYVPDGQLLRFYVVANGADELPFTTVVPRGASLLDAARKLGADIVAMIEDGKKAKKPKKEQV